MDFPTEMMNFDILETDETYVYFLLSLVIFIILGYFSYSYFSSENLLEKVERNLVEMKENIAFYTNKMLLQSNMEGDAIKTTQMSSFI